MISACVASIPLPEFQNDKKMEIHTWTSTFACTIQCPCFSTLLWSLVSTNLNFDNLPSFIHDVCPINCSIINANFMMISVISSCHFGPSFKHPHLHAAAAQSNLSPLLFAASNSNWNSVLVSAVCLSEDYVLLSTLSPHLLTKERQSTCFSPQTQQIRPFWSATLENMR